MPHNSLLVIWVFLPLAREVWFVVSQPRNFRPLTVNGTLFIFSTDRYNDNIEHEYKEVTIENNTCVFVLFSDRTYLWS
jgi:hypothetical protein